MDKLTTKDILSLEAVLYGCAKNKRTTTGGTFVKYIHSDNPQSISFDDAMANVADIIYKFYEESEQ